MVTYCTCSSSNSFSCLNDVLRRRVRASPQSYLSGHAPPPSEASLTPPPSGGCIYMPGAPFGKLGLRQSEGGIRFNRGSGPGRGDRAWIPWFHMIDPQRTIVAGTNIIIGRSAAAVSRCASRAGPRRPPPPRFARLRFASRASALASCASLPREWWCQPAAVFFPGAVAAAPVRRLWARYGRFGWRCVPACCNTLRLQVCTGSFFFCGPRVRPRAPGTGTCIAAVTARLSVAAPRPHHTPLAN